MQLPGFKNAEGAAGNSALCGPGAGPGSEPESCYPGQAASNKQQAASVKKYLTKIINRGTIPYNLKRKDNYGLFSIKNTC
jgi:hypothetical protein